MGDSGVDGRCRRRHDAGGSSIPELDLGQPGSTERLVQLGAVIDIMAEDPLDDPTAGVNPGPVASCSSVIAATTSRRRQLSWGHALKASRIVTLLTRRTVHHERRLGCRRRPPPVQRGQSAGASATPRQPCGERVDRGSRRWARQRQAVTAGQDSGLEVGDHEDRGARDIPIPRRVPGGSGVPGVGAERRTRS